MCGLFLIVERQRPPEPQRARAATRLLQHRGPDGEGFWEHAWRPAQGDPDRASAHLFAGHRRLSILDPGPRAGQPLTRGAQTLVYNGEIYNFRALRADLARAGARFQTDGDTEVLLALLARAGLQGLHEAHGMWAFAHVDTDSGQILAARDRLGKKPLFWHLDAERLCLASEIAPILAYLGRPARMRVGALDTYLRDGWLFPRPDGQTHVEDVQELPGGCALRFDLQTWSLRTERWFDLGAHARREAPRDDELPDRLREAVLSRLVADRNVGLLLSGGIDSSLILSILCASGQAERVHCFTGDAGKSDDALYARRCIAQLGLRAIEVPLAYDALGFEGFLRTCRHQEKPFPFIGNVLALPQLYQRIAEHDVPVVLDGTGGDELFAGYWDRYYRFALLEARSRGDGDWLERSLAANADNPKAMRQARLALGTGGSGSEPALQGAEEDPPELQRWLDPRVLEAADNDPLQAFEGTLSEALLLDSAGGRLGEWLWQNDRNAMASGVENRSPFLDHRLAPWLLTPMARKMDGPWNKLELRHAFDRFVALPTQWRREKQGFRWVYHRFLRHHRAAVLELLAASRILPARMDLGRLIDAASRDDRVLESALLQRSLCIAGLEQAAGLDGPSGP